MLDASIPREWQGSNGQRVFVPEHIKRYWPESLGAATALLVAALFLTIDPCPDVAWQLWIGHQLRHGARLYVDIIETNPPLWFWMAMPIDWVVGLIGTSPAQVMVAAMGLSSALSVIVSGRLLGSIPSLTRAALLVYTALTLMLMPLFDMGQREQILLIGATPYLLLAACRYERRAVSPLLAAGIGIGAVLGFALKHYFLIAPALIELWLFAALGRLYRPVRPETVALASVGLLYAAAVVVLVPAYLHDIVPMLRLTYGALQARKFGDMIGKPQYYWLLTAALLLARLDLLKRTAPSISFAVAAIAFGAAWLIQFKGWHNHELPITGCLMLAVGFLIADHWRTLHSPVWMAAPALLMLPLIYALLATPYQDPVEPLTRPMLAGLTKSDGVAFVSENSMYAWPMTLNRGFRYPSRHYGMWMMRALFDNRTARPSVIRLARQVVDETAQDYSCAQPMRIIFDQHQRGGFDMEGFFMASRGFRGLMTHYRQIGHYHQFEIFQRTAAFPIPNAAACRRGV